MSVRKGRSITKGYDKYIIAKDKPKLSKIFLWYGEDFRKNDGNVPAFINKYIEDPISKNASIKYLDYKWDLNE